VHFVQSRQRTRLHTRPFVRGINYLLKLGCLCKQKSSGRPLTAEEDGERVRASFLQSPKTSTGTAAKELSMSKTTVWRVFLVINVCNHGEHYFFTKTFTLIELMFICVPHFLAPDLVYSSNKHFTYFVYILICILKYVSEQIIHYLFCIRSITVGVTLKRKTVFSAHKTPPSITFIFWQQVSNSGRPLYKNMNAYRD
jgi:hypothetical protein